jgi:hypothetical protein
LIRGSLLKYEEFRFRVHKTSTSWKLNAGRKTLPTHAQHAMVQAG